MGTQAEELKALKDDLKDFKDDFREDFKNFKDDFKTDFKDFKGEIRKNFVSKSSFKLQLMESMDSHRSSFHKIPAINQRILFAVIILATSGAGGAGGHAIKELLTKILVP